MAQIVKTIEVDNKKFEKIKSIAKKDGKYLMVIFDEMMAFYINLRKKNANPKNK